MTTTRTTTLSTGEGIEYQFPWDGTRLDLEPGRLIAIDTETNLVDLNREVPELALVSVSSGRKHALLHPSNLAEFLLTHWDCDYVSHNTPFDFHVIRKYLTGGGVLDDCGLTDLVDAGRWHDTMILDLLVRLATLGGSDGFKPRNLGAVSQEYGNLLVDKSDPYRMRYGELIGVDWDTVKEPGFWDYAIVDAVACYRCYRGLMEKARGIQAASLPPSVSDRYDVYPDAQQRFGVLSEAVQVKAAVALADISRRGLATNPEALEGLEKSLRREMQEKVKWLDLNHPELLSYYVTKARKGELKVNKRTQVPHFQTKVLRGILSTLKEEHGLVVPETGVTKDISASVGVWRSLLPGHPLVRTWGEMQDIGKMLQFVVAVKGKDAVRSQYRTLVTTGRTSCTGPNIQQMPKEGEFRRVFVPRPGYLLAAIDYSFIELRTLASVCQARYGHSRLAEVIRNGEDPHVATACGMLGISNESWNALPEGERKAKRQAAKAVNFGVPGGLGAEKLALYAKSNYGVSFSKAQAAAFKNKLITEVYPELGLYLQDNSLSDLALNLALPLPLVRSALQTRKESDIAIGAIRKIVRGTPFTIEGRPYYQPWVEQVWYGLEYLSQQSQTLEGIYREDIARRGGSQSLEDHLFRRTVATLTGRVRADVGYTEARNTPFQGLAADGGKLALWELMIAGFRVVAFVHDEIVLEIEDARQVPEAVRIMNAAMEQVLHPLVPCACEVTIGTCWSKS